MTLSSDKVQDGKRFGPQFSNLDLGVRLELYLIIKSSYDHGGTPHKIGYRIKK